MTQQEIFNKHKDRKDLIHPLNSVIPFIVEDYHIYLVTHTPTGETKEIRSVWSNELVALRQFRKDCLANKSKCWAINDFGRHFAKSGTDLSEFSVKRMSVEAIKDEDLDVTKSVYMRREASLKSHYMNGHNRVDGDTGAKAGDGGILILIRDNRKEGQNYAESISQVHRYFQKRGDLSHENGPTVDKRIERALESGEEVFGCTLIRITDKRLPNPKVIRVHPQTLEHLETHDSDEAACVWLVKHGHAAGIKSKPLRKQMKEGNVVCSKAIWCDFMWIRPGCEVHNCVCNKDVNSNVRRLI